MLGTVFVLSEPIEKLREFDENIVQTFWELGGNT
jgi:hypothetical protein